MRIARVAEDGRAAGSGVEEKADGDRRRGAKERINGKVWVEFEGRI